MSEAAAGSGQAAQALGPGLPTPPWVLSTLTLAFGEGLVGETGYGITAAQCTSEHEKAEAKRRGSSLLYGELLPDGVSKALSAGRLGDSLPSSSVPAEGCCATVLELGMGSGKVAMQTFLQCQQVSRVLGVELVPSRYAVGAEALKRLASCGGPYRDVSPPAPPGGQSAGGVACVEEMWSRRRLEFRCADFFSLGLDLVNDADIIFFAVHIPCKLFPQLAELLSKAKEGCRLFTYHSLQNIWWSDVPCPFRQCDDNVPESDTFATSWSPQGFRFYVYVCDRTQKVPEIQSGVRNESYSEWEAVLDSASQSYYYLNQETEESQWEVPHFAGCWRVEWSAEHQAYFFWHVPTGHSQWEPPKCLADLGWTLTV